MFFGASRAKIRSEGPTHCKYKWRKRKKKNEIFVAVYFKCGLQFKPKPGVEFTGVRNFDQAGASTAAAIPSFQQSKAAAIEETRDGGASSRRMDRKCYKFIWRRRKKKKKQKLGVKCLDQVFSSTGTQHAEVRWLVDEIVERHPSTARASLRDVFGGANRILNSIARGGTQQSQALLAGSEGSDCTLNKIASVSGNGNAGVNAGLVGTAEDRFDLEDLIAELHQISDIVFASDNLEPVNFVKKAQHDDGHGEDCDDDGAGEDEDFG